MTTIFLATKFQKNYIYLTLGSSDFRWDPTQIIHSLNRVKSSMHNKAML